MDHVNEWIEKQKVIEFLQEAIVCNTINPPGNELELAKKIEHVLRTYDIECEVYETEDGRANLVAKMIGQARGKRLVLNGHLDTVPLGEVAWKVAPLSGEIKDGKMYGRGTSDMKSGLVALLYTFIYCKVHHMVKKGELIFAATFGEETGSIGAIHMMKEGQLENFDGMIIGEPTNNEIVSAHKGALWVKIESLGKTSHSSMPDKGINAIDGMLELLKEIKSSIQFTEEDELLSSPTLTVTTFKGGSSVNVVPDKCTATIDIRTVPGQSHEKIVAQLKEIASSLSNRYQFSITPIMDLPPLHTSRDSSLTKMSQAVVSEITGKPAAVNGINYFTDGSIFAEHADDGIVILGPGKPELAHQPNEYVDISRFQQSINLYIDITSRYLEEG